MHETTDKLPHRTPEPQRWLFGHDDHGWPCPHPMQASRAAGYPDVVAIFHVNSPVTVKFVLDVGRRHGFAQENFPGMQDEPGAPRADNPTGPEIAGASYGPNNNQEDVYHHIRGDVVLEVASGLYPAASCFSVGSEFLGIRAGIRLGVHFVNVQGPPRPCPSALVPMGANSGPWISQLRSAAARSPSDNLAQRQGPCRPCRVGVLGDVPFSWGEEVSHDWRSWEWKLAL